MFFFYKGWYLFWMDFCLIKSWDKELMAALAGERSAGNQRVNRSIKCIWYGEAQSEGGIFQIGSCKH